MLKALRLWRSHRLALFTPVMLPGVGAYRGIYAVVHIGGRLFAVECRCGRA